MKHPEGKDGPGNKVFRGTEVVPGNQAFRGTRASANTSGSDFMAGFEPGEIADLERSAPNEENLFLLPDRF
jgi:hypothetical protein